MHLIGCDISRIGYRQLRNLRFRGNGVEENIGCLQLDRVDPPCPCHRGITKV